MLNIKMNLPRKLKCNILVCFFILLILSNSKIAHALDLKATEEVDSKKDFVIIFTQAVKQGSVSSDTVFVKDSNGNKVSKVNFNLSEDGMFLKILAPEEGYKKGETYTLIITQNLLSKKNNKNLKRLIEKSFKIIATEEKNKDYELNKKADEIIASIIKPEMPDYQKELLIHDYIVKNTRYDKSLSDDSYLPYGVLVKGIGSCLGYSRTMKFLLNKVGIECEIIIGRDSKDAGHAWNIVKLGSEYYQVDATFDDPFQDRGTNIGHKYFNVTDEEMSKDHKWNSSQYPVCNGEAYDYEFCDYCIKNSISSDKIDKINGTVFLPENETAPEGGLKVILQAAPEKKFDNIRNKTVIIPAGKNSVNYSILVPRKDKEGYILSYTIKDYKGISYVGYGYYASNGFCIMINSESIIKDMNTNIPVNIIKAETISGTIYLPNGRKASEDMNISISAAHLVKEGDYDGHWYSRESSIKIPKGSSCGNYLITVPKNKDLFFIQCNLDNYLEGFLKSSMYTDDKGNVCNVAGGSKDINVTLQTGKVVKGNILLADKVKFEQDSIMNTDNRLSMHDVPKGVYADVMCGNYDTSKLETISSEDTCIYIENGVNSAAYSLTVPKDYKKVFMYYKFRYNDSYYLEGYYNEELPHTEAMPPLINLDSNESIIDLKVNEGVAIKGLISLPNNESAPKEGVDIKICSDNGNDKYYSYINIPEGKNSAEYRLLVKKNRKYQFSYRAYKYDAEHNNVLYYNEATKPIEIFYGNIENINLELPKDYNVESKN